MEERPKWLTDMTAKSIPISELKDGAYYAGQCRNARVARWVASEKHFCHWRKKFGNIFIECISHPEDFSGFDIFVPEREIPEPSLHIPVPGDDRGRLFTVAKYDTWMESLYP